MNIVNLSNLDLTELPVLPDNAYMLVCFGNKLKTLNNLPSSIKHICCDELDYFPDLPESVESISFYKTIINEDGTRRTNAMSYDGDCLKSLKSFYLIKKLQNENKRLQELVDNLNE